MLRVPVRVITKASRARLEASGAGLRVWVTAPPEDGKANEAVRRLVAKELEIALYEVQIIAGERSREKVLLIPESATTRLEALRRA